MTPTNRVIWRDGRVKFHKPSAAWTRARCGAFGITNQELDSGDIVIGSKESAESAGMRPCDRCFETVDITR